MKKIFYSNIIVLTQSFINDIHISNLNVNEFIKNKLIDECKIKYGICLNDKNLFDSFFIYAEGKKFVHYVKYLMIEKII